MNKVTHIICGACLVAGSWANAAVNLIANGNFDSPDISGEFTGSTTPSGWNSSGKVDMINTYHPGVSGTSNLDGIDQSVNIDFDASLSQTISTVQGQHYDLSFSFARTPFQDYTAEFSYTITGESIVLSNHLTHGSAQAGASDWLNHTRRFKADSSTTTVLFQGVEANAFRGFYLDGVSVIAVPEPAALGGVFGLAALLVVRRRV